MLMTHLTKETRISTNGEGEEVNTDISWHTLWLKPKLKEVSTIGRFLNSKEQVNQILGWVHWSMSIYADRDLHFSTGVE